MSYKSTDEISEFFGDSTTIASLVGGQGAASKMCAGTPGADGAPASGSTKCCYPTVSYKSQAMLFMCFPDITDLINQCMQANNSASDYSSDGNFIKRQCNALTNSTVFQGVGGIGKFFGEINMYWYVVVAAVLTAVFLGFVWLILVRLFSRCMVWLTIWSLFLALIGAMLFFMDRAGWISLSAALSSVTATVAGVGGANATALGLEGAEAALEGFRAAFGSLMELYKGFIIDVFQ